METSEKKPAKKYDEAFKRAAVKLVLTSGKKHKEVAADLGISEFTLYEWKRHHAPSPSTATGPRAAPAASPDALVLENAALRRENEYLRTQRDILKKTLGILCEPPVSATKGSSR